MVYVIVITAYGSVESRQEAESLGVDYYLQKPFVLSDLRSRVSELLPIEAMSEGSGGEVIGGQLGAFQSICTQGGKAANRTLKYTQKGLDYLKPSKLLFSIGKMTKAVSGFQALFSKKEVKQK